MVVLSALFTTRRSLRCFALLALLFSALPGVLNAQDKYLGYSRNISNIPQKGPYESIAVDPSGNMLVYDSNLGSPIIYTISPSGNVHIYLSASDGMILGALPSQISIDKTGKVYIPDPSNNRVLVSTTSGAFTVLPLNAGQTLTQPTSVVTTAAGDIYILQMTLGLAKYSNGNITQLAHNDPGGAAGAIYSGMTYSSVGGGDGSIFYLNSGTANELLSFNLHDGFAMREIDKTNYTPNGTLRPNVYFGLTAYSSAITSDPFGNVYVEAQQNGQIFVKAYNDDIRLWGGPYIIASALAYTPFGTMAYIDPNKYLSELGKNVNFGPNSGAVADLYLDVTSPVYGGTTTMGGSPSKDFVIGTNTCAAPGTKLGCDLQITSTPQIAGTRTGSLITGDVTQIQLASVGTLSELADLTVAPTEYPSVGHAVTKSGSPYTLSGMSGGIAVDGYGYIHVGMTNLTDTYLIPNLTGGYTVSPGAPSGTYASLIALDGRDESYRLRQDGAVTFVQNDGTSGEIQFTVVESPAPTGIAVDSQGLLYWASVQNHGIYRRSTDHLNDLAPNTVYNEAGMNPTGMFIDSANTIYTFDLTTKQFVKINPNGTATHTATVNVTHVGGIAVLPSGTILYVNLDTHKLHSYTTASVDTELSNSSAPQLAFMPNGDLVGVNMVDQLVDIYQINDPAVAFATTSVGKLSSDSPKVISLTNVGSAVTGNISTGSSGQDFANAGTCSDSVAIGSSCTKSLSFQPFNNGALTSTVVLVADGQLQTVNIALSGTAIPADHLTIGNYAGTVAAGSTNDFTITARKFDNKVATQYADTVHYTSSDAQALLPSDASFNGSGGTAHSVPQFRTAGTQTFTVTDTAFPALTATASFVVTPGTASQVASYSGGQQSAPVGGSFAPFAVVIYDAFANPVPNVVVTFTPGVGCTFASGNTATTDANGVATSPVCNATGSTGTFNVSITTPGLATPFVYTETTTGFSGIAPSGPITFLGSRRINPATGFDTLVSMVVDNKGDTYIFDANHGAPMVYKVTQDGTKTTYLNGADGLVMAGTFSGQLTVDATGKLYIPDPAGNRIYVSSAAHTITTMNIPAAASPKSVIVASSGTTYVLQTAGLFTLSGSTLTPVTFTDPDGSTNANYNGMALNRQGRLFIENDGPNEILSYDTVAHTVLKIYDGVSTFGGIAPTTQPSYPGITVDSEGFAYTADFANGRIFKTLPNGTATEAYTGITSIAALALSVNPSGSIAFLDYTTKTLGNVSDSIADIGGVSGTGSSNPSTMYWNINNVQIQEDYGSMGSDLVNEFYRTVDFCGGHVVNGACNTGVYSQANLPGLRRGFYSFTNGGFKVNVPVVTTGVQSEMAFLTPAKRVIGIPGSQDQFHFGASFAGSTGGLAIDGIGNIYTGASTYTTIDTGSPQPAGLIQVSGNGSSYYYISSTGSVNPSLLTIDGVGNLYFNDPVAKAISRTDLTFSSTTAVTTPGYALTGMTVDAAGLLLYASDTNGTVTRFDPKLGSSMTLYNASGAKPQGLWVDAANAIFTFDASVKKFVKIATDGSVTSSLIVPANNVSAVLVLPSGTVFYVNKDTSTLHSFTPAGVDTLVGSLTTSQLALLPNGGIAAINSATQTLDVFAITNPDLGSFTPTSLGRTSTDSPKTFTFTNVGVSATAGESIVSQGFGFTNSADTCTVAVAPNATCTETTSFAPVYLGMNNYGGFNLSFTSQIPKFFAQVEGKGLGATSLQASGGSYPAGQAISLHINAIASDNTVFTAYRGTLHFTSSDPQALLPPDHTGSAAEAGAMIASVTFKTTGNQTLTITETSAQDPSIAILTTTVNFSISAAQVSSITVSSGNNQTLPIGSAFAPFAVVLKDLYGNLATFTSVTFTSGAGCTFPAGATTSTVTSNGSGIATSPICTANSTVGSFQPTATTPGLVTVLSFGETNQKAAPAVLVNVPAVAFGVATTATATESVSAGLPAATGLAYYAFDTTATTGSPSVTVTNGAELIPVPANLTLGAHTLSVLYGGDTHFQQAAGSQSFTVTKQNIWIVNTNGSLSELSNSGAAISGSNGYFGVSAGIAIDAQGNVWAGTIGGSAVTEFSKAGAQLNVDAGAGINSPVSIAISGSGSVWIANSSGTLSAIASDGTTLSPATGFDGGGLNAPSALSIDASGNVWVANSGDYSITEFLGAAEPVVTPLATAVKFSSQGAKP